MEETKIEDNSTTLSTFLEELKGPSGRYAEDRLYNIYEEELIKLRQEVAGANAMLDYYVPRGNTSLGVRLLNFLKANGFNVLEENVIYEEATLTDILGITSQK